MPPQAGGAFLRRWNANTGKADAHLTNRAILNPATAWTDGYDIMGVDVLDAYAAMMQAAGAVGVDEDVVKADVRALIAASGGAGEFVGRVLARQLAD